MNSYILYCKKYMNSWYMNLYGVHTFYKRRSKNFTLELNHRPQYTHYSGLQPEVGYHSRGIHSLRMGWRNLISSCAVVSVFCSGGK